MSSLKNTLIKTILIISCICNCISGLAALTRLDPCTNSTSPIATPACGRRASPSQFLTLGSSVSNIQLEKTPPYFPILLIVINTIPASNAFPDVKIPRFNSVPAIVKKIAYRGGVSGCKALRILMFFLLKLTSSIPVAILAMSGDKLRLKQIEVLRKMIPKVMIFISPRL